MEDRIPSVSVVVPMYNESECIREFHRRTSEVLRSITDSYEIVIVDDGSTDGTAGLLREICEGDPNVVGVLLSRNRGQSAALQAGFQHSRGRSVIVMDGDLQNRPEEIPILLNAMDNSVAMVKGIRTNRGESRLLRLIPSMVANWLIRVTTRCDVRDMGGYSCINGNLARSLRLRSGQHRLLPAIVHVAGGNIVQVPVQADERFAGKSHYGLGRSLDVFMDIALLWFQTANKQRPVYLFGRVSLWSFLFASGLFVWTLIDKVFRSVPMANRPPFFMSILLFLAALGFMSTGFTLELLSSVGDSVLDRSGYVVAETINYGREN